MSFPGPICHMNSSPAVERPHVDTLHRPILARLTLPLNVGDVGSNTAETAADVTGPIHYM
ncbi:hypothetical protein PGT21_007063 [Puccinia graminis f. sp. tritici]|uniref:Uncharacterized protein n=1 Tax=Puccinia graminis f. sp. tritici TaxID=56615 RepID=A0A5B0QMV1_PUCGR|nr:hypothetical protein PGT21_007063 [Puccinia graminis f. sp. tritici]